MFYVLKYLCEFLLCSTCSQFIECSCIIFANFNGLNFYDRNEQVQFHHSVLNLDLAILEEKYPTITDVSSTEEKVHYKAWERANRLNLMFMRMTVIDSIKPILPKTDNVKEFTKLVGEHTQTTDKSLARILMNTLTIIKFEYALPLIS